MAKHNETGRAGELLASRWLVQEGFNILYVNWRYSHYEIDIIASRDNVLHFVEVKTRSNIRFGYPEESVSKKKLNSLMNAGEEFLFQNPQWKQVQYDILSINTNISEPVEYFFIEDVYDSGM